MAYVYTRVSPTPFFLINQVKIVTTTLSSYNDDNNKPTSLCPNLYGPFQGTTYSPNLIYFPGQQPWHKSRAFVTVNPDFISTLILTLAEKGTTLTDIKSCTLKPGEGAPVVHIAVSALTEHSTMIIAAGVRTTLNGPGPQETTVQLTKAPVPADSPQLPRSSARADPPISLTSNAPSNNPPAPSNNPPAQPSPPHTNVASISNAQPEPPDTNASPNSNAQQQPSRSNVPQPSAPAATPARPETEHRPRTTVVPQSPPSITIGTEVVPLSSSGAENEEAVVLGGTTVSAGSTAIINGQTVSLEPSGGNLVVLGSSGTSTLPLKAPVPSITAVLQPASSVAIGSNTIPISQPSNGVGVILPDGIILQPGSTVISQGRTLSLEPSGSSVVFIAAGITSAVPLFTPVTMDVISGTVISVGTSARTVAFAKSAGGGIIFGDGQTLLPGSTTVVDGTTLSLGVQGTQIVVGSSTIPLHPPEITGLRGPEITIASSPCTVEYATALDGGIILENGKTLLPGSTIVIDGTTLSLESQGSVLVVGTATVSLNRPQLTQVRGVAAVTTTAAPGGLGSYIWSGLGGGGTPISTPPIYTGGANDRSHSRKSMGVCDCWLCSISVSIVTSIVEI